MALDEQVDSPDFTQAEAEGAIVVSAVPEMMAHLRSCSCKQCGHVVFPARHEQRRRGGVMYCRMKLACNSLHESAIVFRVAALQLKISL